MRRKYLFIRILEACNANCFMCDFALSKDRYRFSNTELKDLLLQADGVGVGYVRLTGGEPLLHPEIRQMLLTIRAAEMKSSIITNGSALPAQIAALADSGLDQIIVSIDGLAASHDDVRGFPGLFDRCIAGLEKAVALGINPRVNTVVGPHNYRDMPDLQSLLTEIGVTQWELTAIKLDRHIAYSDPEDVIACCAPLYEARAKLVPMGHRFWGETPDARDAFFNEGVCPKPQGSKCHLVGDVIYINPKMARAHGCSLLPHRTGERKDLGAAVRDDAGWRLGAAQWAAHVEHFQTKGHLGCKGCSATAAGYSDRYGDTEPTPDWAF